MWSVVAEKSNDKMSVFCLPKEIKSLKYGLKLYQKNIYFIDGGGKIFEASIWEILSLIFCNK